MDKGRMSSNSGWKITRSITMELDAALGIAGGSFLAGSITPNTQYLHQSVSSEWIEDWNTFFHPMDWFCSILETSAILAGVLDESDYSRATMAIRQLTPETALANLLSLLPEHENEGQHLESIHDAVIQHLVKYRRSAFEAIHFTHPNDPLYESRLIKEVQFCLKILHGGEYHDRFWHWLDQFYYGIYQPWCESRMDYLVNLERQASTMLGEREAQGVIPDLTWLSDLNPALRYPEIHDAICKGSLFVNFIVEPFGFSDAFVLLPGCIFLTIAEPGQMYENFVAYSRELSGKMQALADPTRLIILRLIRAMSMTNTDMAAYLGLARPTVSIHARILREAGLIRSWEEGRVTRHEIDPAAVHKLFRDLEKFLDLPSE